ncbi:MAG: pyridoxal-phosphate dependent enzyme [Candidatus Dormibacteria bacterium]
MEYRDTILDCIGNTPLIRLSRISTGLPIPLYAKAEQLNPGGSVKDRIGLSLIEAAERSGKLQPGGTIIEPTSGNTGHGLAIAAALRGYRCIFVLPDKMSDEKIRLLEAYGAEVIICPTNVEREDPRSYYEVANRLAREIPGGFQPNQYFNPANPESHYRTTGPEIWHQTSGSLTAFVAGIGTGGTISGTARYLKEQNPAVTIVGADPEGSIYSGPVAPYVVEGVGEDFFPDTYSGDLVDRIIQVSDQESFLMTRRLAREEGLLVGGSAGMAVHAAVSYAAECDATATVVVLIPDTGRNYLSKIFSDDWMVANGYLSARDPEVVGDLLGHRSATHPAYVSAESGDTVERALALMERYGLSHLPLRHSHDPAEMPHASLGKTHLYRALLRGSLTRDASVGSVTTTPLPTIPRELPIVEALHEILEDPESRPRIVIDGSTPVGLISLSDLTSPKILTTLAGVRK